MGRRPQDIRIVLNAGVEISSRRDFAKGVGELSSARLRKRASGDTYQQPLGPRKQTVPQQSIERKTIPGSTIVKKIGSGVTIARKAKIRAAIAKTRATQTTSTEIQYADFSERLLAAVIDGLLVIIVPFPVVIVSSWIGQSLAGGEDWGLITGFCVGWIFVLVLAWIYSAIMESSSQQATLGKIVLGIVVTNHERQRLSFHHDCPYREETRSARYDSRVFCMGKRTPFY